VALGIVLGFLIGVAEDLEGVLDGDARREVGAELGEAADVAGGDHRGAGADDGAGFVGAETGGDFGLVDVVGTGAAAAEIRVGDFEEFEIGDGAEELARFVEDALGVGEMAGVLVGDAARGLHRGEGSEGAEAREEGGDVADAMAKFFRFGGEQGAGEDEVVFVQAAAAAGGGGDDGVDVFGKGVEVLAGESLCGGQVADVPGEGAAAALVAGDEDFDPVAREDVDSREGDVGLEDLLGAAGEESDAGAAGSDGFGVSWERDGGWQLPGQQGEHGAESFGEEAREEFAEAAETRGPAEATGIWKGGGNEPAAEAIEKGARAGFFRPRAEGGDEVAIGDTAGAGGFAGEAAEAGVNVGLRGGGGEGAFEDLFHQDDAAAGAIHFLAEDAVGGAGGEAKAAMDAGLDSAGHGGSVGSVG
jgi:hypothetical protein